MGQDIQESELGRHVIRKMAWRLIPFLILLYFFAFLDRVNVGFAALTMNADIGLSSAAFGLGAGIFFIGYVLFEVPSNVLLERFGARVWIARIMISWGLLSAAMAFVQGPVSFYVIRFLLGIAEAGFFPGIIYYLTCWFPTRYRARIIALFLLANPLSGLIGAPISTALLGIDVAGLHGWQWMFLIEAIPSIVLGVVVLFWLTNRPAEATWLTTDEKGWLQRELDVDPSHHGHGNLWAALAMPRVWVLGLVYFGMVFGVYGFTFWLPQILKSLGTLTNFQVGLASMLPYAMVCVAMVLWGRHSDATGERTWHVAGPPILGAAALVLSSQLPNPLLAFAALSIAALGIYSGLPAFWALASRGFQGAAAAAAIALMNSIGNVGGFLGPYAIGLAHERTGTYVASLLLIAGCLVMASALVLWLGAREGRAVPVTQP